MKTVFGSVQLRQKKIEDSISQNFTIVFEIIKPQNSCQHLEIAMIFIFQRFSAKMFQRQIYFKVEKFIGFYLSRLFKWGF